jgi:hypothetical protein
MWNVILIHLETVLVSVQYRCTVCAKATIGSEIILDAPDVTLGDWLKQKLILVSLEIVLILVQNSCSVCADRTIGQKSFWTHEM